MKSKYNIRYSPLFYKDLNKIILYIKKFTKEFGGAMAPRTPSDIFERFLKKHEMPKITFHQIRHTSVSLLINGGVQT